MIQTFFYNLVNVFSRTELTESFASYFDWIAFNLILNKAHYTLQLWDDSQKSK